MVQIWQKKVFVGAALKVAYSCSLKLDLFDT